MLICDDGVQKHIHLTTNDFSSRFTRRVRTPVSWVKIELFHPPDPESQSFPSPPVEMYTQKHKNLLNWAFHSFRSLTSWASECFRLRCVVLGLENMGLIHKGNLHFWVSLYFWVSLRLFSFDKMHFGSFYTFVVSPAVHMANRWYCNTLP